MKNIKIPTSAVHNSYCLNSIHLKNISSRNFLQCFKMIQSYSEIIELSI